MTINNDRPPPIRARGLFVSKSASLFVLSVSAVALAAPAAAAEPVLAATGVAICVVEHNVAFVRDLCDEGVFMFGGKVLARGAVESLIADPQLTELYFGT